MTVLDGPMGKVAQTLIGTFGRPAVLKRAGDFEGYNPSTLNVEPGISPTEIPCEVTFVRFEETSLDGTLVQQGDRAALVSRERIGTEPIPGSDKLTESGSTWDVVAVSGVSSGAEEAMYALHLRR
jgi:hypothetical protein